MTPTRAFWLVVLGGLAAVAPLGAQEPYPSRPITVVAPFPPGGVADLTARPVAAAMEKALKNPVGVVNKTGAAGAVGMQFVATSKPDGYTLLLALSSISIIPEADKLFGRPPAFTVDQFAPIVLGVVLAPMIEMALRQSLAMSDGQYAIFLERPISATLLGVGLVLITLGLKPLVTRSLDWRARLALAEKGDEHR